MEKYNSDEHDIGIGIFMNKKKKKNYGCIF